MVAARSGREDMREVARSRVREWGCRDGGRGRGRGSRSRGWRGSEPWAGGQRGKERT